MATFSKSVETYKKQLEKGDIQVAYKGLMEFILGLRNHLKKSHPEFYVSGNFYQGNLDFTYFSFTPVSLQQKKLRIAVVFLHRTLEFKVWLGGQNKTIQEQVWRKIKVKKFKKYRIPESIKGVDFIVESLVVSEPDFDDLTKLRGRLEKAIIAFATDMESQIAKL